MFKKSAHPEHVCQIWNNSPPPHYTKNKVSIKTRSQAHAGKILERTELSSHFPMPSTTTSRSSFPSIIKISVGKWKHDLELKAQSEFVD